MESNVSKNSLILFYIFNFFSPIRRRKKKETKKKRLPPSRGTVHCPITGFCVFQFVYLNCSFDPVWIANPVELQRRKALYKMGYFTVKLWLWGHYIGQNLAYNIFYRSVLKAGIPNRVLMLYLGREMLPDVRKES